MFKQLKQLFTHSVIYGIGYVAARLITFLLLPLYTNVLTQEEYGIIGLGFFLAGVLKIAYGYGSDSSFIRYYEMESDPDRRHTIFSTLFWSLIGTSMLFTFLISVVRIPLATLLFDNDRLTQIILLIGGIIFLDTLVALPKSLLRVRERPVYFTVVNLINVGVTLALNIWFIVHLKMGVQGAFFANLIASGTVLVTLIPVIASELKFRFSSQRWKELLGFGIPLIPAGLAAMIMEMIDRPILKELTDVATVGLYNAGYKLGIFMMLVVSAFYFAWQPFFMKVGQQDDGPEIFARVFTYFMFILCGLLLTLTVLLDYIVQIPVFGVPLLGKNFLSATSMVPIIFGAYLFYGMYINFMPGIYLKKRSGKLALYTAIGAGTNVIGNLLLIPVWGINGAATATLAGYAVMAFLLYHAQQRLYPTPYQWKKVLLTFTFTLIPLIMFYLMHPGILGRIALILIYFILQIRYGTFQWKEIREIILRIVRFRVQHAGKSSGPD